MNVMHTARSLGLAATDGHAVSGTIDEVVVLDALGALAVVDPGNDDLYADAAMAVQLARSAGVVHADPTSVFQRARDGAVQLRYRSELADVFTDLAIDVGIRTAAALSDAPA